MRWGMVIDLGRCVGCQTCTIACKQEHTLPDGIAWRFVADCEVGEYPDVRRVVLPMQCMHCEEPPCVPVWRLPEQLPRLRDWDKRVSGCTQLPLSIPPTFGKTAGFPGDL